MAAIDDVLAAGPDLNAWVSVLSGGVVVDEVPALSGQVSVDGNAHPRRTLSLEVAGLPAWVPTGPSHPLDPRASTTLRVEAGVRVAGEWQRTPLGVFIPTKPAVADSTGDGLSVKVTCSDLSARAMWPKMWERYTKAGDALVSDIIKGILTRWVPWLPLNIDVAAHWVTDFTAGYEQLEDPWSVCVKLAESVGYELFVDVSGVARCRQISDPAFTDPSFSWVEGPTCLVSDISREVDAETLINGVLVPAGSSREWDGIGAYWDQVPGSPTERAVFGEKPFVYAGDASLITSKEQADQVAQAEYVKRLGMAEQVAVTTGFDPRRDVGDVGQVTRTRAGVDAAYRVASLQMPLFSDSMSATFDVRRVG